MSCDNKECYIDLRQAANWLGFGCSLVVLYSSLKDVPRNEARRVGRTGKMILLYKVRADNYPLPLHEISAYITYARPNHHSITMGTAFTTLVAIYVLNA
jgi:hypothetical protein